MKHDYTLRGKCEEMSKAACAADLSLRLVRGHYHCPIWGTDEGHWWTVRKDGTIYDPTAAQFPSLGKGTYREFNGIVDCAQCGMGMPEDKAMFDSNYAFCSGKCYANFVGLGTCVK